MSTIITSKTFKVFALVALLGVMFLGGVKYAKALTAAEATAICTALNLSSAQCAVIQALVAPSAPASCVAYAHSATLRSGSVGSQVSSLQSALNAYNAAGLVADGKFGPATAAAARAYQAKKGLSADGVVGAMTAAPSSRSLPALCLCCSVLPVSRSTSASSTCCRTSCR